MVDNPTKRRTTLNSNSESQRLSNAMFNFILVTPAMRLVPSCIGFCLSLGQHWWSGEGRGDMLHGQLPIFHKKTLPRSAAWRWNNSTGTDPGSLKTNRCHTMLHICGTWIVHGPKKFKLEKLARKLMATVF